MGKLRAWAPVSDPYPGDVSNGIPVVYWTAAIRRNELHINSATPLDEGRLVSPDIQRQDTSFVLNMGGEYAVNLLRISPGKDARGAVVPLPSAVNIYLRKNDPANSWPIVARSMGVPLPSSPATPVDVLFPNTAAGQYVEVQPAPVAANTPNPFPVVPILRRELFNDDMLRQALDTMKYLTGQVKVVYGDEPNQRVPADEFAAAYAAAVRYVDSYMAQHASDYQNVQVKHGAGALNAGSNMLGIGGEWWDYMSALLDIWKANNVPSGEMRLNMPIGDKTAYYLDLFTKTFRQLGFPSWVLQSFYIGGRLPTQDQWAPNPDDPVQAKIIQAFKDSVDAILAQTEITEAAFWRLFDSDPSDFSLQAGQSGALGLLGEYYRTKCSAEA